MELGFTILSLVLFSLALFFAFLHVRSQFTTAMRSHDRRVARQIKKLREMVTAKDVVIAQLQSTVETLSMKPVNQGVLSSLRPFEKMQDRIEKQMPNVVVNETPMAVPRA